MLVPVVLQDYNHFALLDSASALHNFPTRLFRHQTIQKEETEKLKPVRTQDNVCLLCSLLQWMSLPLKTSGRNLKINRDFLFLAEWFLFSHMLFLIFCLPLAVVSCSCPHD